MPRRIRRTDEGFTLAELSTVVTIVGAVSAAAVLSVNALTANAKSVACAADREAVRVAAYAFMSQDAAGRPARSVEAMVSAGLLLSAPVGVTYRADGVSFSVSAATPCSGAAPAPVRP